MTITGTFLVTINKAINSLLLKDIEKRHIERVLRLNGGNKRKTARDIGVVYNTLMKKVRDYGIDLEGVRGYNRQLVHCAVLK